MHGQNHIKYISFITTTNKRNDRTVKGGAWGDDTVDKVWEAFGLQSCDRRWSRV